MAGKTVIAGKPRNMMFTFMCDAGLAEQIKKAAAGMDATVSWWVRQAVREKLEREAAAGQS
jgi:predicted transcriptional regulator